MRTDGLNTGRDRLELQETNSCFIVLDGNDLIVSCNHSEKYAYFSDKVHKVSSLDCFWLDSDQCAFHFSEFKKIVGKEIKLLYMPSDHEAYSVKVMVEAFQLLDRQYYSLFIQDDQTETNLENINLSYQMARVLSADLKSNSLELNYQPQINIADNSLYGVEALARWTSKKFGRVAPDDFIALAEEFGLIAELDLWVLRQACKQFLMWRELNIHVPIIAVNFSPLTLNSPNLAETVQVILAENALLPSDLVIEVTENKSINSSPCFVDTIARIHATGVTISLDDFGTGYSNLKRLLKFPVSQLKLDRVFVDGLSTGRSSEVSKELSKVVLSLSKKMHATAIAEGVETQQQLSYLSSMGYKVIQGYIFSPPLPQLEFEHWCSKRK